MKLEITKCHLLKGAYGNSLCITHLKLLDQNGKYVRFIGARDAFELLDGKMIEVVGMLPKAKKKREDKKSQIQRMIDDKNRRAKKYPQKEFTTC